MFLFNAVFSEHMKNGHFQMSCIHPLLSNKSLTFRYIQPVKFPMIGIIRDKVPDNKLSMTALLTVQSSSNNHKLKRLLKID